MKQIATFILVMLLTLSGLSQTGTNSFQGLWETHWTKTVAASPYADAAYHYYHYSNYLYVEDDSIWVLDYPCERRSVSPFTTDAFQMINDSTIKYGGRDYSLNKWCDTAAISNLKSHQINPDCYLGKWRLNYVESGGDGTGHHVIYPFDVDTVINITEALSDGEFLTLRTGKSEREFQLTLEHDNFVYCLVLTPTDSWDEKENIMWRRDWDLPTPNKKELKEIRGGKGELPSKLRLEYSRW